MKFRLLGSNVSCASFHSVHSWKECSEFSTIFHCNPKKPILLTLQFCDQNLSCVDNDFVPIYFSKDVDCLKTFSEAPEPSMPHGPFVPSAQMKGTAETWSFKSKQMVRLTLKLQTFLKWLKITLLLKRQL